MASIILYIFVCWQNLDEQIILNCITLLNHTAAMITHDGRRKTLLLHKKCGGKKKHMPELTQFAH